MAYSHNALRKNPILENYAKVKKSTNKEITEFF